MQRIILFGGAALEKIYKLPDLGCVKEYWSEESVPEKNYRKVEMDAPYRLKKISDGVETTTPLDTICYIIHSKNYMLLADAVLCNTDVKYKSVCSRYRKLYGIPVPERVERYISNIKNSNVAEYIRLKNYDYSDFLRELPKLLKKLNCDLDNLEASIKTLL